ncbi:MAG TPA: zinc metalloprotease HtpX [Candidatus Limnocylindrales bacterium]|nr:zinc metalloprotease HtpX [Candidatus Limnocylindrales bacterium]
MGSYVKTAVLLGALSAILLLIGQAIGGQGGMMVAFVFAVVMNFGSYWFSDKIVLRMYRAQEVGADHPLYVMVQNLARQASLPMPRVYIIPTDAPNAFATGRNPSHAAVAATEGILRALTREELEGVLAHELAHVQHRDILIQSIAATIGAAIMMLANMAQWSAMFGGFSRSDDEEGANPIALLATAMLAPLAAGIVQAAISRSREFAADEGGARLCRNPRGLATALQKIEAIAQRVPMDANPATAHLFIVKPFSGRGMMNLFSTHPPTEERVARLLAMR